MSGSGRALLKRIMSVAYTHQPSDLPDVFIHSTQRSGSTLLFDAIASRKGMKAVGEPLQERKRHAISRYIQEPRSRYFSLDSTVHERLHAYLDDLLSGSFVGGFERSYSIRNPRHHFFTNRNAVKILRTFACSDRIAEMYPGAKHIALVRHPVPTVLSRLRNGWSAPIEEFLIDPGLIEILTREQHRLLLRLARSKPLDRHVAVWLVEHFGVRRKVRTLQELHVPIVALEHIVVDPPAAAEWLSQTLHINDRQGIEHRLGLPSRSTRHSTKETTQALSEGKASETLSRWTELVDAGTKESVAAGLSLFDIDFYDVNVTEPRGALAASPWE